MFSGSCTKHEDVCGSEHALASHLEVSQRLAVSVHDGESARKRDSAKEKEVTHLLQTTLGQNMRGAGSSVMSCQQKRVSDWAFLRDGSTHLKVVSDDVGLLQKEAHRV